MTWNYSRNRTRAEEKKEEATAGVDNTSVLAAVLST